MKRVVVTGATGFLGRPTADRLRARGWEVVGVSRSGDGDTRRVNLLDPSAVHALFAEVRPSHLLHAAWQPVRGNVMQSPENLEWLAASLALVRTFQECGGVRAAVVGSSGEYDWTDGICRNGVTPMKPASIYGACKHALHIAIEAFARVTGLGLIWPRVFFVYGPGEDASRLVASVVKSLLQGMPAECTEGLQVRDYCYVDDVAAGLVAALESNYDGAVDLASGNGIAVRDLVLQVANKLDRTDLVRLGARPSSDNFPLVLGDPTEAGALLGWSPRTPLAVGIADTIAWGRQAFAPIHSLQRSDIIT
jgi:nucleoside-diphosphate-sugar epimerase